MVSILLRQAILKQTARPVPTGSAPYVQNPMPFIAGIPVTTRQQEAFSYQADVTDHTVEDGSIVSDHVILKPLQLELSFEISNWEKSYAKYSFELLESLFTSRTPVDLLTEHKQLTNMVMTSLHTDNSSPVWGKLSCRASFKQLKFITLETVAFSSAKVTPTEKTSGPSTPKAAETKVDKGKQTPKQSTLSKVFNG